MTTPATCPRCNGNGRVEMLEHCPSCAGSGLSPAEASRQLRELTAKLAAAERERDEAIANAALFNVTQIQLHGANERYEAEVTAHATTRKELEEARVNLRTLTDGVRNVAGCSLLNWRQALGMIADNAESVDRQLTDDSWVEVAAKEIRERYKIGVATCLESIIRKHKGANP